MRRAWLVVLLVGCRYAPRALGGGEGVDAASPDAAPDAFVAACVANAAYTASPTGRRYRVIDQVDYDGAIDACTADGAHLAVVDDSAENAYLASLANTELWIGLDDLTTENTFTWVTGAPVSFLGFTGSEPNDSGVEDCTLLRDDGTWNDTNCGDSRPAVCECDPAFQARPTPACRTAAGATTINGRRYFIRTAPLAWPDAEADCEAIGAHLVVLGDKDENDAIFSQLNVDSWIGLSDQVTEGTFVWVDGAPTAFTNFGVPTANETEDCVDLDAPDATWNDTECTGAKPFACECDPAPP